jgi:hypothetical protein
MKTIVYHGCWNLQDQHLGLCKISTFSHKKVAGFKPLIGEKKYYMDWELRTAK